jgi:hypothetical protein
MKHLISIILVILIAGMFSGCVIVDAHYNYRHGYHSGIVVTNVPPPPPYYYARPFPPPPIIYEVRPSPPGPPHHSGGPRPDGRRDLRR